MKSHLQHAALLALSAVLAGCVDSPQTPDEFKAEMKSHPSWTTVDTYTSNRPFDAVVAAIEGKWRECYNFQSTSHYGAESPTGGYSSRGHAITDTYHPQARKVNNSLVEMTLQQTTQGMKSLNKVPPGGLYTVVLDIERLPGNKTKLSWYSNSGWSHSWERNKQWSDGKNVPCRDE